MFVNGSQIRIALFINLNNMFDHRAGFKTDRGSETRKIGIGGNGPNRYVPFTRLIRVMSSPSDAETVDDQVGRIRLVENPDGQWTARGPDAEVSVQVRRGLKRLRPSIQ